MSFDGHDCQQRVAAAYEAGHNDGKASVQLTERVSAEVQAAELAARYELGRDEGLDEAVEDARAVLAGHPALLHQLEQKLIGRYSPAGRAESTALPEPTWAPGPPPTPAGTGPAGTREESE